MGRSAPSFQSYERPPGKQRVWNLCGGRHSVIAVVVDGVPMSTQRMPAYSAGIWSVELPYMAALER
jgi:hypothetical protein